MPPSVFALGICLDVDAGDAPREQSKSKGDRKADAATPEKKLFSGKVVLVQKAQKNKDKKASGDKFDKLAVLKTAKGESIPIVPDWRGKAFYQDKRLRNRKVDLVGFREKDGDLKVLMVFVYNDKGQRQYMDYWCDICSIPMYEIKPCDCCQAPIRLRFQTKPLPAYLKLKKKSTEESPSKGKAKP